MQNAQKLLTARITSNAAQCGCGPACRCGEACACNSANKCNPRCTCA